MIKENDSSNVTMKFIASHTQKYVNEKTPFDIVYKNKFISNLDKIMKFYLRSNKGAYFIDSLLLCALNLNTINDFDYSEITNFSELLNENPDTNDINVYSRMLPSDLSENAKCIINYSASIYKSSFAYWNGKKAPKGIVIIDAAGALLGSLEYLIDNSSDWSWGGHALVGGVGASLLGWLGG